jgi:hypothetical protein
MTVIVYAKDVLAADSRAIGDVEAAGRFNWSAMNRTKLRVNKTGTMAVAVCGPIPSDTAWQEILSAFTIRVVMIEEFGKDPSNLGIREEELEKIAARQRYFLVMTRVGTYFLPDVKEPAEGGRMLQILDNQNTIAYGAGVKLATMAFNAGLNGLDCARLTCELDATCGAPVTHVHRNQLKKFITSDKAREKITDIFIEKNPSLKKAIAK